MKIDGTPSFLTGVILKNIPAQGQSRSAITAISRAVKAAAVYSRIVLDRGVFQPQTAVYQIDRAAVVPCCTISNSHVLNNFVLHDCNIRHIQVDCTAVCSGFAVCNLAAGHVEGMISRTAESSPCSIRL